MKLSTSTALSQLELRDTEAYMDSYMVFLKVNFAKEFQLRSLSTLAVVPFCGQEGYLERPDGLRKRLDGLLKMRQQVGCNKLRKLVVSACILDDSWAVDAAEVVEVEPCPCKNRIGIHIPPILGTTNS